MNTSGGGQTIIEAFNGASDSSFHPAVSTNADQRDARLAVLRPTPHPPPTEMDHPTPAPAESESVAPQR